MRDGKCNQQISTLGLKFFCTRDVIMGNKAMYVAGRIYKSEVEGCITDEEGDKEHEWIEDDYDIYWKGFFRIWHRNKRRRST